MQTKWIFGVLVLAIVVVGGFFLFQHSSENLSSEQFGNPIKIGAILISSGDFAAWGENAQRGIQMAIDEHNERSSTKIEIIYEDTGGDTKKAVSGYRKLVDLDSVDAILGPLFSAEVAAVAPLLHEEGVPGVTPSVAAQERPNPRNPLMIWMDAHTEGGRVAEYVLSQGIREVGVLGTHNAWETAITEGFVEQFESLGGTVVAKEIAQPETTDIRSSVTKITSQNPEGIFLGTAYQFIQATKAIDELDYDGRLFSVEIDDYLAGETVPFSNGLHFISPDFYTEDFVSTFTERYGQRPAIPAGQAYDAANILITLLVENESREDVIKAMSEFESYTGVSGEIIITDDHRTLFPTAVFELQNGESIKLK